jgi:hypothetical protein
MRERSLPESNLGGIALRIGILIAAVSVVRIAAAASGTVPARRLAILSSEEIQESGLSDLLTVQLQELPNVGLVERTLLKEVMDEVALTIMLGADQPENRRKAGALLKDDMLVLLSLQKGEDSENVKVVISDCSSGARLHIGWVPFERFKEGVRQIIGVSYFISRNLVHDYDHLQAGYTNLLGNALSSLPGIAVIEIEEARSIRLEEQLAGDMQTDRVVPLFVEGEFRVDKGKAKKPSEVHMTVRISDNAGTVRQIERKDLSMDKVAQFITDDVATELLRMSKAPSLKVLDKQQQLEKLVARASEFARVGAWEESIALREAALLVHPNSVDQRIKLMDEYRHIRKRVVSIEPSWLNITGEYEHLRWRHRFEHLEYLIYNKLISMKDARELSNKCLRFLPNDPPWLTPTPGQPTEAELFKKDFLRQVYPEILKLRPSSEDPSERRDELARWYGLLLKRTFSRCDGGGGKYHDKEDLHLLLDLHTNVVPDGLSPSPGFVSFLKRHCEPGWRTRKPARGKAGYFTEEEFLDFIKAMSNSEKTLPHFYGRYALLYHQYCKRQQQGEAMDDLRDEAALLVNEMKEHKFLGRLTGETENFLKKIEQYIKKQNVEAKAPPD